MKPPIFTCTLLALTALVTGCSYSANCCRQSAPSQNRLAEPRIAPIDESQLPEEQRQLIDPFRVDGKLFNIIGTLMRHPELTTRFSAFGSYILNQSTLPARDREILILRTGWLCGAEYEFGHHTEIAKAIGMADEEIARVTKGADAEGWTDFEAALIRAADELHFGNFIENETWAALDEKYSEQQLMDLVFTVGEYHIISMAINSFGVQLEEGFVGFPAEEK